MSVQKLSAQDVEALPLLPLFPTSTVSHGHDIIQTADSNFVTCGTAGTSPKKMLVVKFGRDGDTIWTYTRAGSYNQEAYSIREIEDGSYIIGGYIKDAYGHSDFIVLKLTDGGSSRTVEWYYTYGDATSDEVCNSIITTYDEGFLAAGSSSKSYDSEDFFVVKMASNGSRDWINSYGGSSHDAAYSVCQLRDSTYMICGSTESFGVSDADVYLVHIDQAGDILSTNIYTNEGIDVAYSIYQCEETGFVIAGYTDAGGENKKDMLFMKVYDDSTLIWRKTFGGGGDEIAYSVRETKNYGFALAGSTTVNETEQGTDILLVTTDDYGDSIQGSTYGNAYFDEARAVYVTQDNTWVMTGTTSTSTVSTLVVVRALPYPCAIILPRGIWFGNSWEFDANETPFKIDQTMLIDDGNPTWHQKMESFIDYCVNIKAHTVVLNNLADIYRIDNSWSGGAFSNFPDDPYNCNCYPSVWLGFESGDTLRNRLKRLVSNLHLAGVSVVLAQWLDQERNAGQSPYDINDGSCSGAACDLSGSYVHDETAKSITNISQILDAFITFNTAKTGYAGEEFNGIMVDYEYFSQRYGTTTATFNFNYEHAILGVEKWMEFIDLCNTAKADAKNNNIRIVQAYMSYICFTDPDLDNSFLFDFDKDLTFDPDVDTRAQIDAIDEKQLDAIVLAFPIKDQLAISNIANNNPIAFLLGEEDNGNVSTNSLMRHRLEYFGHAPSNFKTNIIPWFRSKTDHTPGNCSPTNDGDSWLGDYLLGQCEWNGPDNYLADAENIFKDQFFDPLTIPNIVSEPEDDFGDVNIWKGFQWFQFSLNDITLSSTSQIRAGDKAQAIYCAPMAQRGSSTGTTGNTRNFNSAVTESKSYSTSYYKSVLNSNGVIELQQFNLPGKGGYKITDVLGRDVTKNFKLISQGNSSARFETVENYSGLFHITVFNDNSPTHTVTLHILK